MQRPRKMYDRAPIGMCRRRWWPAAIRRGSFALTTRSAATVRLTPTPLVPFIAPPSGASHLRSEFRIATVVAPPSGASHLRSEFRISVLLALAAMIPSAAAWAQKAAPSPLGIFRGESDVGRPSVLGAGSLRYDPKSKAYVVTGGGANMWASADHFHYVWIRLSGDVALEATVRFTGTAPATGKPDPHRKACLLLRQSLDADSPYADAALHGDGLTSLQWRDAKGAVTHEVQSSAVAPERLRIEKRGDYVTMSVATRGGQLTPSGGAARVPLTGDFYIGIAVSAHDTTRLESATFAKVSLTPLAPLAAGGATAIVSTVETISLRSKDRRAAAVVTQPGPIGEAFWYPDTTRMVYFRGALDRLFRVKVDYPGQPTSLGRLGTPQPVRLVAFLANVARTAGGGLRTGANARTGTAGRRPLRRRGCSA